MVLEPFPLSTIVSNVAIVVMGSEYNNRIIRVGLYMNELF